MTTTPSSTAEPSVGAATVKTSAPAQASSLATTPKPKAKHKRRRAVDRVDAVRAERPTFVNLPAAVVAARREAGIIAQKARVTSGTSLSDGELVAAATLLLLFVAAAASVLRLSARMLEDTPAGRFG